MGVIKKAIKVMFQRNKWKILRGDTVVITTGKDKGQQGVVRKVIRDDRIPRVIVEGRNLVKRHIKRQGENPGGIITTEAPLHYSNVALVDPVTSAPVRVTWRFLKDGTKVRVTRGKKASGSVMPRPEILLQRRKPRPLPGLKDTPVAEASRVTTAEGDAPSHPVFMKGILPPRRVPPTATSAAAQGPPLSRTYSTARNAGSGSMLSQRLAAHLSAQQGRRLGITSWRGFAAGLWWQR